MDTFRPIIISVTLLLCISFTNAYFSIPLNQTDDNGCRIGQEFRGGSCKLCHPGTYRFLGPPDLPTRSRFECYKVEYDYDFAIEPSSSRCLKCPAGTFNPYFGAKTAGRCIDCPPGTTSGTGARKCWKCGSGKSSISGSPRCVKCWRGYFITPRCVDGELQTRPCTKCPRGTYSTGPNRESCTPCPDGTSTKERGAFSKRMCKTCGTNGVKCSCRDDGERWSEVQRFRPIGAAVCTFCPAGTRVRTPFSTKPEDCEPCPDGTEFIPQVGCKKCPKGLRSFGRGASACRKKETDKCPLDTFKDYKGVCKLCRAGYFWNSMKKQCDICPPGTTSLGYRAKKCKRCNFPKVASPSAGRCICTKGYFMDYNDASSCKPCPKGTKKEKELHEDSECDPDCDNFPNQPACRTCKPGYERDYNNQGCKKCEKGLASQGWMDRCGQPRTGCGKKESFIISAGMHGYFTTCSTRMP